MTLWTIQPFTLYEKLLARGVLHCDPESEGFWGFEDENFRAAYDWLARQMKARVGPPPEGVQYPFWAWALIDGVSKKPDLRRMEFRGYVGENVVLELEIPNANILLSDEVNWHYVLNNLYLHNLHGDDEAWEDADAWFDSLPTDKQESVRRKSWERIFDKQDADNDWIFVQATFWELRVEQVKSVRRFTGRGKAGKQN